MKFRFFSLAGWFGEPTPPRPPTHDEIVSYLRARAGGPFEPPAREVPFWDAPAVLVLLVLFGGVVFLVYSEYRQKFLAAGSSVGTTQGDLAAETVSQFTQTFNLVDAATQTGSDVVGSAAETTWSDLSVDLFSAANLWVPHVEPVVDPVVPVVLGENAAYFVGLPWGYLFAGGAVSAGLLWLWPALRRPRLIRDCFDRFGLGVLLLPAVMVAGGAGLSFFSTWAAS